MIISERAEEIMEALWEEIVENSKKGCDSKILQKDEVLKELVEARYVEVDNHLVKLTKSGREEAANCVRRHRLAERLFTDLFDVKGQKMIESSCKFEHILHKGIDENICTLLGHPTTCPHGKQIPSGNCCKDTKRTPCKVIVPLHDLDKNRKAKISYLKTTDRNMLQKIIAMGALPNAEITLIQKFPSYVFEIGKTQFAIDKELASHIYVRAV